MKPPRLARASTATLVGHSPVTSRSPRAPTVRGGASTGRSLARPGRAGIGFNGFRYHAYLGYDVVPRGLAPAELPMVVRWEDALGRPHQTHLRAGDYGLLLARVIRRGRVVSFDVAVPGERWMAALGGDF
jgi:hypothetical protein